jgi:phage-related protein
MGTSYGEVLNERANVAYETELTGRSVQFGTVYVLKRGSGTNRYLASYSETAQASQLPVIGCS